ncbi:hypothetical protein PC118_g20014 [Phytophthora cactorum]|uniref:Secreted protein n=1 Tax=Phytophthora cactorum TaxID=29920 RepID=A0A8T1EZQ8_9STRA|nr:hypothetical protein PC111_g19622 [Phytophthora cactorum]KAG2964961.1 hypothetical protein PC118_g20014 [Phytophthora cactorum]
MQLSTRWCNSSFSANVCLLALFTSLLQVEGSTRVCFTVNVSPTKCRLTVEAETLTPVSRNSMVFIASSVNMQFSLRYVSKSATVSDVT